MLLQQTVKSRENMMMNKLSTSPSQLGSMICFSLVILCWWYIGKPTSLSLFSVQLSPTRAWCGKNEYIREIKQACNKTRILYKRKVFYFFKVFYFNKANKAISGHLKNRYIEENKIHPDEIGSVQGGMAVDTTERLNNSPHQYTSCLKGRDCCTMSSSRPSAWHTLSAQKIFSE